MASAISLRHLPPDNSSTAVTKENQVLVRFNNEKTHVLRFPFPASNEDILNQLSARTNIPKYALRLHDNDKSAQKFNGSANGSVNGNDNGNGNGNGNDNRHYNSVRFLSASTFLPIRGGKGGFGTLLKGQSKKAGARQTVDFGACRDLNGRRLRHVNDEIKLRVWRESMNRRMMRESEQNGGAMAIIDVEKEMEELKTASGIRNWHLMTPSWGAGEMSNKSRRKEEMKMRRELERYARDQKIKLEKQLEKKRVWDQSIKDYAISAQKRAAEDERMSKSILEGMGKRRKMGSAESTQKAQDVVESKATSVADMSTDSINDDGDGEDNGTESISFLSSSLICSLSGDVVIEDGEENGKSAKKQTFPRVQSKSEFATATVLTNASDHDETLLKGLYYEITIESAGISQIGWAKIMTDENHEKKGFAPNSDTGDGVGDDEFSYGYDGLRHLSFHNGKESAYGANEKDWKDGDIVGCMHNVKGELSFSINGRNMGIAFDTGSSAGSLSPVFSLNQNEIISLNIGPAFEYCPDGYKGVSTLLKDRTKTGLTLKSDDPVNNDPAPMSNRKKELAGSTSSIGGIIFPVSKPRVMQPQSLGTAAQQAENDNEEPSRNIASKPLNLNDFNSSKGLEKLGMNCLKKELYDRGCKCGGSLVERASRLYSIKGLNRDEIPRKIRGKNFCA
uniref:B30.2/SPRY domain-containing protein n=1 Tax=Chaetoceros debilis TaxID=122233 RepID=A0A7S3Q8U1_9STRA|mmetsp:Transcript_5226/g.7735  ORF Transcript_5226/g.7735 Transcript_5226/m.7735 type:complete len:677 (+) Transcript_5226:30-2060(+)